MGIRILVVLLFGTLAASIQPPSGLKHPGVVIDIPDGKPIPGAQATAYKAARPDAPGPCPTHDTQFDQKTTRERGEFEFLIPRDEPSYFAMYCANNFQSRPVPGNENRDDNTFVRQHPVKLYPLRARLTSKGLDPIEVARRAIVSVLDDATGDLKYFRTADPGGFEAAMGLLAENRRSVVRLLLERGPVARPRELGPGPANVSLARRAVGMVLAFATGDLQYFRAAAPEDFSSAIRKLPERDSAVVDLLVTPPPRGPAATIPPGAPGGE